jgi:prepilin-type N-terminal cleavage/methylation domain-containing protein
MSKPRRGFSLIEVLIAIALSGVLAALSIPYVLPKQPNNVTGAVDSVRQALTLAVNQIQMLNETTGQTSYYNLDSLDFAVSTLNDVYSRYGNYFIYKLLRDTPTPPVTYFLLPDGSRMTSNAAVFYFTNSPTFFPLKDDYAQSGFTPGLYGEDQFNHCGGFGTGSLRCMYVDINGIKPPNRVGRTGDIVPLAVDIHTEKVQSLYQWALDSNVASVGVSAAACRYYSVYDTKAYPDACKGVPPGGTIPSPFSATPNTPGTQKTIPAGF